MQRGQRNVSQLPVGDIDNRLDAGFRQRFLHWLKQPPVKRLSQHGRLLGPIRQRLSECENSLLQLMLRHGLGQMGGRCVGGRQYQLQPIRKHERVEQRRILVEPPGQLEQLGELHRLLPFLRTLFVKSCHHIRPVLKILEGLVEPCPLSTKLPSALILLSSSLARSNRLQRCQLPAQDDALQHQAVMLGQHFFFPWRQIDRSARTPYAAQVLIELFKLEKIQHPLRL